MSEPSTFADLVDPNLMRPRAYVYIDLGYLQGERRAWLPPDSSSPDVRPRLNLWSVVDACRRRYNVVLVNVYDAVPADGTPATNAGWHDSLRKHTHVKLHLRPSLRPPHYEQKQVDVALTADMIQDVGAVHHMVLVSGDDDFVPAIEAVRRRGGCVTVAAFFDSHAHKSLRVTANDCINLDDEPIVILRWSPEVGA